jgi:uncharacterized membrane protein
MKKALHRNSLFAAFGAAAALGSLAAWLKLKSPDALLIGYDIGALLFLGLLVARFRTGDAATMRARAVANDPDHATLVMLVLAIIAVVATAVTLELVHARGSNGFGVMLAAATLTISWVFTNAIFTLHYAHLYYLPARSAGKHEAGGLKFPGNEPTPDYWDFAYFAFVLGMAFQVSDVEVHARPMRRLVLAHSLIAFVFNIAVVALSVNLVATAVGVAPSPG